MPLPFGPCTGPPVSKTGHTAHSRWLCSVSVAFTSSGQAGSVGVDSAPISANCRILFPHTQPSHLAIAFVALVQLLACVPIAVVHTWPLRLPSPLLSAFVAASHRWHLCGSPKAPVIVNAVCVVDDHSVGCIVSVQTNCRICWPIFCC